MMDSEEAWLFYRDEAREKIGVISPKNGQ